MTTIPTNDVTVKDMIEWEKLCKEIAHFKQTVMATEMLLRKKIFAFYFPVPKEGTNTAELANNFKIKGTYKLDRKLDIGVFTSLRDQFAALKINADTLVHYEPELKLAAYRELTAEQQHFFDQCMVVKPASPTLEIVLPKKATS